jgi:hypothetical protein
MLDSQVAVNHAPSTTAANSLAKANRLIVFARQPEPGKVKTRLIPAIGSALAARLHCALAEKTFSTADRLQSAICVDVEIRVTSNEHHCGSSFGRDIGESFMVKSQIGVGLGDRLECAVRAAFCEDAKKVVVIGTDCPDLDAATLLQAFNELDNSDLVLGPALDGGYYLIGMRTCLSTLFQNVDWGSEKVLEQTLAKSRQLGLEVFQLQPLSDVDHPEDLVVCRTQPTGFENVFPETKRGLLSIIVATRNEGKVLESTLRSLTVVPDIEVIVADGGSSDRTAEIANRFGARVVPARMGRGRQMNAGAAMSRGETLLFLHADTLLPERYSDYVHTTLAQGAIAGSFRLGISGRKWGLRLVELGANFRSRIFQLPYGDQGLFLRADTFFGIGGFRQWPLMEDYEFCQRLRQHGRIQIAPEAITTSDRRWRELGIWRTTLLNQIVIAAYRLGVSPERLAKWYETTKPDKTRFR